jgi:hypothetical protein
MSKAKIITMCGSLKFIDEIKFNTERLALEGNCVLSIIYPTKENEDKYTAHDYELLGILHKQKIEMSDAIFVVNVNGYIGNSTRNEIEYAKSLNKEVLYLVTNIEN